MNISQSLHSSFYKSLSKIRAQNGIIYVFITIMALAAFEAFNFSTTDFALSDLLGDLRFIGVRWSTLLSIAFCGIDFAGIARLFAPKGKQQDQRFSVWYLFGAWFLAATMNTILTWWGIVMAMQTHPVFSAGFVEKNFISRAVPIFIALMVWIIRVLLIGTLSKKSDKIIKEHRKSQEQPISRREYRQAQSKAAQARVDTSHPIPMGFNNNERNKKPARRPEPSYIPMQEEPLYHSMNTSGQFKGRR